MDDPRRAHDADVAAPARHPRGEVPRLGAEPARRRSRRCAAREIRTRIGILSTDVLASAFWVSIEHAGRLRRAWHLRAARRQAHRAAGVLVPRAVRDARGAVRADLAPHWRASQHARVAAARLAQLLRGARRGRRTSASSRRPDTPIAAARRDGCGPLRRCAQRPRSSAASLEVPAGHAVAIVGPVGAGKSTLLRVLARDPAADVRQRRLRLAARARACAYVPQEAFILNASVRENIVLRHRATTRAAATSARADHRRLRARPGPRGDAGGARHGDRRARRQPLGRAEAARGAGARVLTTGPASCSSTIRCRPSTCIPRTRSSSACCSAAARDVTRVVVTHRLAHLARFDHVVFLVEGRIAAQGTLRGAAAARPRVPRLSAASADAQAA